MLGWICLFLLVFSTPNATAQHLDAEVEGLLAKLKTDAGDYEKKPVPSSAVDPVSLDVHWRLFKRVVAENKLGGEELDALTRDTISLGHRNNPAYATAVYAIAQSKAAQAEIDAKQASKLFERAQNLAPDLPYPTLAHSAHLLHHDLGRFPAIVGLYIRGVGQGFHWLDTRIGWGLKLSTLGLLAFLGAFLLFLLAQLLRHFGIIAYDFSRLLPAGFSSNQTVILLVAAIIVPGLIFRSPLLSALVMLAILSLSQNINERVVTVLIFGTLAALPFVDQRMTQQLDWPESDAQRLFHAQYQHCATRCASALEQQWLDSGGDPLLTYSVALSRYRTGSEAQRPEVVRLLDGVTQWPGELRASVYNLKGAALVAEARPDDAVKWLELASADPLANSATRAAAAFNLMRAHQMNTQRSAAAAALDQAIKADLGAIRQHLSLQRRDVNSFLLVEPLAPEVFWQRHQAQARTHVSLIKPVWRALAGPEIALDDAPMLGVIGILLALLGLPLMLTGRMSTPCPKCAMARDPHDAPRTGNHRYCVPCYHTFVSGASLEYSARVHNEKVLGRRERFQDILRRALSLLAPGSGHMQAGHGLLGFLVLFLTLFGLAILWLPMGVWRVPAELTSDNWAAQRTVAWLLVAVGASVALSAVIRGIRPAQERSASKPRRDSHG